jgi:O-acetyl-ADP-ribose deacetylase (regulator of RNase III)
MTRIVLVEGDITEQAVDAIVNAANSDLILGTGVAGAISERGGPTIAAECAKKGPIEVGEVAVTGAGELSARLVIHAAGMPRGGPASEDSVRRALRQTFRAADEEGCALIACPAIGAGVGGLSVQTCAEILLEEARRYCEEIGQLEEIRFVLFGEPAFRIFEMVNDSAKVEAQMQKIREQRGE